MKKIWFIATICGMMFVSCDKHTHEEKTEYSKIENENNPFAVEFHTEMQEKVDFATGLPSYGEFGQIIKAVAKVENATDDAIIIVAKTSGTISFTQNITLGIPISAGKKIFSISSDGFSDNMNVRLSEAKNNYNKAKAEYERSADLAKNSIVSEKELQQIKLNYENTKVVYDNLQNSFSASGQNVVSKMSGFITQLNVVSGQFVEAGQALATISKNKKLFLTANISPKYIASLSNIQDANIRTNDENVYSLAELNGRLVSYGKAIEGNNFLIPVTFQIENRNNFVSGSFTDVYIKTLSDTKTISVPNTALVEEMGNYFVYVQLSDELFEKREVLLGMSDGKNTEIKSGILANERIVTKGAIYVKLNAASGKVDAHSGHAH